MCQVRSSSPCVIATRLGSFVWYTYGALKLLWRDCRARHRTRIHMLHSWHNFENSCSVDLLYIATVIDPLQEMDTAYCPAEI